METLIKANRTRRAKVAILCMSAMFLCNHAVAQNTFTVSEKENIKGTECTKTFSCYYGENDERIMHGLCKTVGSEKSSDGPNHKYSFSHSESINYSHGKKEGAYSFSQKTYSSSVDVYHDYQVNRDFKKKRSGAKSIEVTGNYKNDERDGIWKENTKETDTLAGNVTEHNKSEKNTFVFTNGKLTELTTKDVHYTFRYATRDRKDVTLLSGKYDKYTIKDGIIVSHIVRLNGDETPIESDLKQFIDSKENLFEHQDELLEKGYIREEALTIKYKQRPNIDEFDYNSCTIYKIKKEQIIYASQEDIQKYLNKLSELKDEDFEEEYSTFTNKKYIWVNGKKYIKEEDLPSLLPTMKIYKERFSQIQSGLDSIRSFEKRLSMESGRNQIYSIISPYEQAITTYSVPFKNDNASFQARMKKVQECLEIEQDYYSYVIKKDKINLINAKADSIKNIAGENSQIWRKYKEVAKDKYVFESYERSKKALYDYIKKVDAGLNIADNCLDYIKTLPQLNVLKETIEKNSYFNSVKTKYNETTATLGDGWNGKENGDRLRQQMTTLEQCLDYLNVLPKFNTLKEAIAANPYFNYVKTKYDATIASLGNGWNGQENGDGLRQQITKLEQYKNHIDNIATIEKNNERIMQLTGKAKNIKKIYTAYYNNIQKEYTDNPPANYMTTVISNQNALMAALEANDAKELDKTVKKGKAETMEDIIQLLKQQ